jgi:TMEM151 family
MTDKVRLQRVLVGSRRWISATGLLLLLTLSKSSARNHPKMRGGGGGVLSTVPSSSTTTKTMSTEKRHVWNHHLQNKQIVSLQSRFVNDEAKVIAMQTSSRKSLSHVAATCLTLGIVGLLVYDRLYVNHSTSLMVWYLILVIAYLGEAFSCSTRRYLSNMLSPLQLLQTVQTLVETRPVVTWKLECYHYNQNRQNDNSRKGHGHDSTQTDKVVTYRATRAFQYSEYVLVVVHCWGET